MKRCLLVLLPAMILQSCASRQETIHESQKDAMIDSMVALRMEEVMRQSSEDLDRRRSIEVKAKADSIVAARTGMQPAPADNTAPADRPLP